MFGWCYNIIVDVEVRGGFDDAESSLAYVILHRLGRLFGLYDVCLRLLVESYNYNSSSYAIDRQAVQPAYFKPLAEERAVIP